MDTLVKNTTGPEKVSLTAQDRCDRCGAQAYHVARKDGLTLQWCSHHEREYGPALVLAGWQIVADSASIDNRK